MEAPKLSAVALMGAAVAKRETVKLACALERECESLQCCLPQLYFLRQRDGSVFGSYLRSVAFSKPKISQEMIP